MQRLNNKDIAPPDFFSYVHSQTGHRTTAPEYYTWMERIRAHCIANNLPIVTEAEAEDQICKTLGPEWCSHSENTRPWVNLRFSIGEIAQGFMAYAKFSLSGFKGVDQAEANRRARICSGCFLKTEPQGCGACSQMAELITGDLAKKRTDYDAFLERKACGPCKCPLKPIVHFPLASLEEADPHDEKQALFPEFCWRLKGGENYQPA